MEVYHKIKVVQGHRRLLQQERKKPSSSSAKKPPMLGSNETLLSQPSPIRKPTERLYTDSPIRPRYSTQDDDADAIWNWSPDHPLASSTPIHRSLINSDAGSQHGSPLRFPVTRQQPLETMDSDDIGFDGDSAFDHIDFDAMEMDAIETLKQGKKRSWDD